MQTVHCCHKRWQVVHHPLFLLLLLLLLVLYFITTLSVSLLLLSVIVVTIIIPIMVIVHCYYNPLCVWTVMATFKACSNSCMLPLPITHPTLVLLKMHHSLNESQCNEDNQVRLTNWSHWSYLYEDCWSMTLHRISTADATSGILYRIAVCTTTGHSLSCCDQNLACKLSIWKSSGCYCMCLIGPCEPA